MLHKALHEKRWVAWHWVFVLLMLLGLSDGSPTGVFILLFFVRIGPLVAPAAFFYWYLPLALIVLINIIGSLVRRGRATLVPSHMATALFWLSALCAAVWGEYVGP